MGWLSKVFGLGGGDAVAATVDATGKALDSLFTSDDERLSRQEALERVRQEPHRLQALITLQEAAHRSVFVAGWRPFIGWVCGLILAYTYIVRDLAQWLLTVLAPSLPPLPSLATMDIITEVIFALLGLGALRTAEKVKGAAQ